MAAPFGLSFAILLTALTAILGVLVASMFFVVLSLLAQIISYVLTVKRQPMH